MSTVGNLVAYGRVVDILAWEVFAMPLPSDYLLCRAILTEWHPAVILRGPCVLPILADRLDDDSNPHTREAQSAIRYWYDVRTNVRPSNLKMDEWLKRVNDKYGQAEEKMTDGGNVTRLVLRNRILNWFTEATIDETVSHKLFENHPITKLTVNTVNWNSYSLLLNTEVLKHVHNLTLDFSNALSFVSTGMSYLLEKLRAPMLETINIIPGENELVGKGIAVICIIKNRGIPAGTRILWNGKDT